MNDRELIIQQQLQQTGTSEFVAHTGAMAPLIRPEKDVCILKPVPKRHLKTGEVILYRRKDGRLTVGRITRVHRRVSRIRVCGDNRKRSVHGITRADIVGMLAGVKREGSDSVIYTSSLLYILYSMVMRFKLWIVLGYMNRIYRPIAKFIKRAVDLFKPGYEYQLQETDSGHHHHHHHHHTDNSDITDHSDSTDNTDDTHHHHHHHHHHHSSRRQRNPFKITSGVWGDLMHGLEMIVPAQARHKHNGNQAPEVVSKRSLKSLLMFWKKKEHHHHSQGIHYEKGAEPVEGSTQTGAEQKHHHHHHVHTSYDDLLKQDHGALQIHHGQYFFMGLRLPWVPKFLLDKYGLKKIKGVNNNIITKMDWSIHSNEFQMPYNMQMQTLSAIVFLILFVKILMAVGWLLYFIAYGNENSSRIYVQNLIHTATWFPIALFFISYYYHLNKIFYMSIQKVTLMAAAVSLVRVVMFVITLFDNPASRPSINLVTAFNLMEVICWVCISGFFFIMHFKLSGRHDFIPHFWLTKKQNRERLKKEHARNVARAKEREKLVRAEYDHEQHSHLEH